LAAQSQPDLQKLSCRFSATVHERNPQPGASDVDGD